MIHRNEHNTTGPLITAMMPAHNEAAYIGAAIESVLEQTYQNWELIIVDDGSTDDTVSMVQRYDDPRIRLIQQLNQGRSAARNRVLENAGGKYIAVTDADDISRPFRFEKQLSFLEAHPHVGIVSGQMKYFSKHLAPTMLLQYPTTVDEIDNRFEKGANGVIYGASMYRREIHDMVGAYVIECVEAEDLEFFLRAKTLYKFACLQEVVLHYRSDPRTFSLKRWQRTHRYAEYATYRSHCFMRGTTPLFFNEWRNKTPSSSLQLFWDIVRYLRFQYILHTQTTLPLHGPHSL